MVSAAKPTPVTAVQGRTCLGGGRFMGVNSRLRLMLLFEHYSQAFHSVTPIACARSAIH